MSTDPQHVTVERDGHLVGEATLHYDTKEPRLHADVHIESGHQPPDARAELIDAVVDHPLAQPAEQLSATLPAGDSVLLDRLRDRCGDVETHTAGSTVLATARTPADRPT